MDKPYPGYRGNEPYVFVSYAHKDEDIVYPDIRRLQDQGVNVWYDEGIDAGDEWTDTLADAISGCFNFLYFVTPNSVVSEHCRRELNFAHHKSVAVTAVHLVPTELPGGLQLSLGNRQAIIRYKLAADEYQKALARVLHVGGTVDPEFISSIALTEYASDEEDDRQGILVLPFANRSRDEDSNFICEGISDQVITALSSINSLRVISGSAARQIDAENPNLKLLRKLLNVHYVLEGSLQKSGERMRITAQLPNTKSGEVLWASKWDGTLDEIFDIQDNISLSVIEALEIHLSATQSARVVERPIPDVRAYEYFLRARQLIHQWTEDALRQALEYLLCGEEIIGENEYIISARGYVYWQFHNLGVDADSRNLDEAQKCIDSLFELDPNSPDAHRLSGLVKIMSHGEIQESVDHLKLALDAHPNDTDSLFWLCQIYGLVGRVRAGFELAERLLELDPITPLNKGLPAILSLMDGNSKKAVEQFATCHEEDPGNPIFTMLYGQSLAMNNQFDEAAEVFSSLHDLDPELFFAKLGQFYIYCMRKDKTAAKLAATDELKTGSRSDPQWSWCMAQCYALLDEQDEAVDWAENAINHGFWNYPLLAERDTLLEPVRQHERYKSLMTDLREKWIYFKS